MQRPSEKRMTARKVRTCVLQAAHHRSAPAKRSLYAAAAILAMAGAVAAILLLISCAGSSGTTEIRPEGYTLSSDTAVVFSNADAVVQTIREALTRHDYRITIRFQAQGEYMGDISPLISDLMNAALTHTGSPIQGDYLRYQYGGYTVSYSHEAIEDGWSYEAIIEPDYYTTPEQETAVDTEVQNILKRLHFTRKTTDAEKVAAIYRYVCDTVQYDTVHAKNEQHHLKTTAYAALVQKRAVCQGYCVAMYRLLLAAGVDCRILTGSGIYENGESEYHSWNLVCIDGEWYNMDVTWDVQDETEDYYLKADASFKNHIRDAQFDTEAFRSFYPMAASDYEPEA